MKPIAALLFRIPLLAAAAMLLQATGAVAAAMPTVCPAPSVATTPIPYNPFGVTVPWAKTSTPGVDLYAGLTSGLDTVTRNHLAEQAQGRGAGTLVLFLIDVSAPTGFPKLIGKKGNGTTGEFTWPFSRHDKVVEQNGHRFYQLELTLERGCWNINATFAGSSTPTLVLPVP